jgi:hypothetical protein
VVVTALIALHICATLLLRAIAGFDGVVLAMAVAPATFVAATVHFALPVTGWSLLQNAAAVLAGATVTFGAFELVALAVTPAGAVVGAIVAVAGVVTYAAFVWFAYPDAARAVQRLTSHR